jgi:hypothetical protein
MVATMVDVFAASGGGSVGGWFASVGIGIILFYAFGLALLYWVIRLAVRHAIRDAGERRSRTRA